MVKRINNCIMLSTLMLLAAKGVADELSDPMRPPETLMAGGSVKPVSEEYTGAPILQSILLSSGRRLAIINNRVVGLGARVGDARVVNIGPDGVSLKDKKGIQRLMLLPSASSSARQQKMANGLPFPGAQKQEGKSER